MQASQNLTPGQESPLMLSGAIPVPATSDIADQWARIRAIEAEILQTHAANSVHVVSQSVPARGIAGGRIFEVDALTAAKNLYHGTHRLATADEIKAYGLHQIEKRRLIDQIEADRRERQGNVTARDLAEGVQRMMQAAQQGATAGAAVADPPASKPKAKTEAETGDESAQDAPDSSEAPKAPTGRRKASR